MSERYGHDEINGTREDLIELRNAALEQGAMEWAVVLSNTIAILHQYLADIRNGVTLNELE